MTSHDSAVVSGQDADAELFDVEFMERVLSHRRGGALPNPLICDLLEDEGRAILNVIRHFERAWRLLGEYDAGSLAGAPAKPRESQEDFTIDQARIALHRLRDWFASRGHATGHIGSENGERLCSILEDIQGSVEDRPVLPSSQERAAHLLYRLIKEMPFLEGGASASAFLFLEYSRRNDLLRRCGGVARLDDTTIVCLVVLIGISDVSQKDRLIQLILRMLED